MAEQQPSTAIPVLDALIEIRRSQKQVEAFRTRAEANRDKVDPEVFRRVMNDYADRHAALAREALPLKAEAAGEYRRLRTVRRGIEDRHRDARLLREEIEFRHTVGEIDSEQLATQLQGPAAVIAECEAELARSDQQKARFGEAMTDEELEGIETLGPGNEPTYAPASAPEAVRRAAAPYEERTVRGQAAVDQQPAFGVDATYVHPDLLGVAGGPGGSEDYDGTLLSPAVSEPDQEPAEARLPEAVLIGDEGEAACLEFRLGPVNNIGRADDNEIRLVRTGVSRHHATVLGDIAGYTLRDLGSQNGTFLNGERVTESPLTDGDRIWVGAVELVFKLTDQGA